MNLLFTGDFCILDKNKDRDLIDSSILDRFRHADYRTVGLESPITNQDKSHRILKVGPHLRSSPETTIPVLKALNVDLASLANNHILDYGRSGLLDTLNNLRSAKIGSVGAGIDLSESRKAFILDADGLRIAILAVSENEWASAGPDRAGANPLDLTENARSIREAKKSSDHVIVIVHGGNEYYNLPSPGMVKFCRFLVENGASVVIGHHAHCISGRESYGGSLIFYGLGNFVFADGETIDPWNSGLILDLDFRKNTDVAWQLIPVVQYQKDSTVTLPGPEIRESIMNEVEVYSRIISDQALLSQHWHKFVSDRQKNYLSVFSPVNSIRNQYVRYILTKSGFDRLLMSRRFYAQILNYIRCESHAEAVQEAIERYLE